MRVLFLLLFALFAGVVFSDEGLPRDEASSSTSSSLRELLGGGDEHDFLPPDQAFRASARSGGTGEVILSFEPAQSYYLYRSKFAFSIEQPAGAKLAQVSLPEGEWKQDPIFGKTEVYHHKIDAVLRIADARSATVSIKATYQGCSERGLCYPPENKVFQISLAGGGPTAATGVPGPGAMLSRSMMLALAGGALLTIAAMLLYRRVPFSSSARGLLRSAGVLALLVGATLVVLSVLDRLNG